MNKSLLCFLSSMVGWTAGLFTFGSDSFSYMIFGYVILFGGMSFLLFKYCNNDVPVLDSEPKEKEDD